ncbi:pantoate--beta-alanine ligase [Chelatococcus sp. SYSU_G07232]|uniref:Pantothenate synthetase n=1 Tax=Chelatococcus albus TaxID=3047466 RepID=A0ABT7ACV8_9HYPH|nr:pantoate--beta-alanine ligase [Chelatococcus sp. SYSU_G07232]MDJ1157221.1 pantoate--beta-alanine ligase [Chelatococcus sp. SYSU_G07232]
MHMTPVAPTVEALRRAVGNWRREGARIALVPTMGALHEGHLSLVEIARRQAERVVVSIFVNPTQFGPNEDFAKYPRTLDDDRRRLGTLADLVFAPSVEEMYPAGFATTVSLEGPATAGLEDAFRPTHFAGVATVVSKLFIQTTPDFAVFGEKDYQQLKVVTRMTRDLDLPVTIVPGETVREADGLAMSSRNRYLSAEARAKAPAIHATLSTCAARLRTGEAPATVLPDGRRRLTDAGFTIDYLEARNAETLAPVESVQAEPVRLLVAARLDGTRLIDNLAV